jgi:hypothetical protein
VKHVFKIIFLSLVVSSILFTETGYTQTKKPKSTCGATGFADCPLKGCGGDSQLNRKKNRRTKPAAADVVEWTLTDVVALKFPKEWTSGTQRTLLESWGEGKAVQVKAFIIHAKNYPSGMESCNCNLKLTENNDFHLVLVDSKKKSEKSSVTAEITPHIRPAGWTIKKLRALANDKAYVRVTGLAMLDTQHLKRPIKRLTNWELHPVIGFEVCTETKAVCDQGSGWQDLAEFPEPK